MMDLSKEALAYQRNWAKSLRSQLSAGTRYAFVNADTPHEVFHALGMPIVVNQWWSSVIAAKQLAGWTLDRAAEMGFHDALAKYSALPMISVRAGQPEQQPWGGLPPPALLCARQSADDHQRIFELMAEQSGAALTLLHAPAPPRNLSNWWVRARKDWEQFYGSARLDLMQSQIVGLISQVEDLTGRRFDPDAFAAYMARIERQEMLFEEASGILASAPKVPLRINEQIPNVMIPQWHRGSDWALRHAARFRDAVAGLVASGTAVQPRERVRMMWIGAGLWFDTGFYRAFEDDLGAVFAWSMYLPFAADGYIRHSQGDDLRALAARVISMNEQLHQPPWAGEWLVKQARDYRIDLAVMLVPEADRPSGYGTRFIAEDLRQAGVAVVEITADMVDGRRWNGAAAKEAVRAAIRNL